jgi:DNA invertase Pin-like site-specific DNA recombinase
MVNLAIYVRVSTNNQTYFRQIEDIKKYIDSIYTDKKTNIEVYAENISGFRKSSERPELTRFLNKVKENPKFYKCLYVTELSRVGRNPIDARTIVTNLLEQQIDVCVTSTNGGQNFLNQDGSIDKTRFAVLGLLMDFAQIEVDQFKSRTASGLKQKVFRGGTTGGLLQPFGYTKNEAKQLVIDPDEAETIKFIFNAYQQGQGMGSIAQQLIVKGVKTRANKAFEGKIFRGKDAESIKWNANQIYVILTNTIYYGERIFKKKKTKDVNGILVDNSEKFDSPHSAIISKKLFDECTQIRLSKKGNGRNIHTKNVVLLQYLTTCGVCGRNFTHRVLDGNQYYICSSRVVNGVKSCANKGVSIDLVDSSIYDVLCKSESILKYLNDTDGIKKDITRKIQMLETSIPILEKEFKINENKINSLLEIRLSGDINNERFQIKNKELESIGINIQTQIDTQTKQLISNQRSLKNLSNLKLDDRILKDAKGDRNKLKSIFKQIIKDVTITEINFQFICLDITLQINGVELDGTLRIVVSRKGMRKAPYQYQYRSEYFEAFNPALEDEIDYYNNLHEFKKYEYSNKSEYDNIVKDFTTITDNIITIH